VGEKQFPISYQLSVMSGEQAGIGSLEDLDPGEGVPVLAAVQSWYDL
jgi:hypothetical protein